MSGSNIAETYFKGYNGRYVPDRIESVYEKYGKKQTGGCPLVKYIFVDDSYIDVWGGEVASINGEIEGGDDDEED